MNHPRCLLVEIVGSSASTIDRLHAPFDRNKTITAPTTRHSSRLIWCPCDRLLPLLKRAEFPHPNPPRTKPRVRVPGGSGDESGCTSPGQPSPKVNEATLCASNPPTRILSHHSETKLWWPIKQIMALWVSGRVTFASLAYQENRKSNFSRKNGESKVVHQRVPRLPV